ncbi:hypothetical protein [Vibrio tritonius]|uniref:hypothetical protein n=1 Tax=Vibrio tritonius TaxID=1435069 RepID=UPI00315D92F2
MMKDFVETMKLRGQAAENIYFSQRDRELIEQIHRNPEVIERCKPDSKVKNASQALVP